MNMKKSEIINKLIEKKGYKTYLEIGVAAGENYNETVCEYKSNVDPCFDDKDSQDKNIVVNLMTSDQFFENTKETFDIIFIDGLHVYEQVYRDITNSLKILNSGGSIVCHDMLPPTEWHQRSAEFFQKDQPWNGDCWKAVARIRTERNDLKIYTVNTDWGVSIIHVEPGQKIYEGVLTDVLNYSYFQKNVIELMNVVTPAEFLEMTQL
jgi:predicted O-methyltransferase YrrM